MVDIKDAPEIKDITWYDFMHYINELANDIQITRHRMKQPFGADKDPIWYEQYRGIVAIARGGLFVAAQLLHAQGFDKHFKRWPIWVDTMCMRSYAGTKKGHVEVYKFPTQGHSTDPILIVDDLSDSGETLLVAKNLYPNSHTAVLFTKPQGNKMADFAAQRLPHNPWIKFPWEV